jgi:hypothetical protein
MIAGENMKKNTFTVLRIGAALLFGAASVASATTTDYGSKVDMKYDRGARETFALEPYRSTCPVHIVLTEDARQNKETIGQSGSGALLAGDISRWVTDGLAALKDYGYVVDETRSVEPPAAGITVKTSVTRAYTWHLSVKIFSMVALKAEFIDRNGVLQEKYYRAHGDKSNIWGADSEYATTLNYGLNNLLPAVARDLQSLCKGQKVESYTYSGPAEIVNKK